MLIHGLGVSSDYWARLMPILAARRKVHALDLPGFGRTEDPAAIRNGPELARAVAAWIYALGLRHAHVLAHSAGRADCCGTRQRPTRTGCLAGPGGGDARGGAIRSCCGWRCGSCGMCRAKSGRSCRWWAGRTSARAPGGMLCTSSVLNNEDSLATLARLHLPIMVVRGGRDPVMTAWSMEQLVRAAPHARAVAVPRAPHGLHWSHPRTLGSHVNAFFAEVEAAAL